MKLNHRLIFITIISLCLFALSSAAFGQLKVRYVDSDRILSEYPAAQETQKQLDELKRNYENEFSQKQATLKKLIDEIQNQSLLLSPEKKAEKEGEAQNMQAELERFYYEKLGPQGEYYRKNQELVKPLIDTITQIIQRIGQDEGYDYILDRVQGVVLFGKAELDITDKIIEELGKAK